MKTLSLISTVAMAWSVSTAASAQLNLPRVVQLPSDDFVYSWGENVSVDDRERPDFSLHGTELPFDCTLNGSFRPGSRMRDFYNMREFELALQQTIYFIQDATRILNDLYLANELDWAVLDCVIPESTEPEDKTQERVDKALERAIRERERRREREARDND
jgi:hypothetical protein